MKIKRDVKISEFIVLLNELKAKNGDLEVTVEDLNNVCAYSIEDFAIRKTISENKILVFQYRSHDPFA